MAFGDIVPVGASGGSLNQNAVLQVNIQSFYGGEAEKRNLAAELARIIRQEGIAVVAG